ncbi:MAG: LLM class F420-dependent oxidoreductase [Acidimicrobiales bacterium]
MDYGIIMFPADYAIGVVELGQAVEQRGFESLFFPEHTHIPASRLSPYPGGDELPDFYFHTLDPFVALGAVASTTQKIKLGTGICLVIERDPITTAKEVASLDFVSDGRVLFGVGAGWNREEMENHGTDPARRMALMAERIHAMKAIWTEDEASFHGDYVNFDRIWSWPKPFQRPHPPVVVGGNGPTVLDRVLDFGDEWMPVRIEEIDVLADRITELRDRAAAAGRGRIPVSLFGASRQEATLERYAEIGIDRCLFMVPSAGREEVLRQLDADAELMAKAP